MKECRLGSQQKSISTLGIGCGLTWIHLSSGARESLLAVKGSEKPVPGLGIAAEEVATQARAEKRAASAKSLYPGGSHNVKYGRPRGEGREVRQYMPRGKATHRKIKCPNCGSVQTSGRNGIAIPTDTEKPSYYPVMSSSDDTVQFTTCTTSNAKGGRKKAKRYEGATSNNHSAEL